MLICANRDDADKVEQALIKIKPNRRDICRDENKIFEFVYRNGAQARFASKVRYQLPIQPRVVEYEVEFDCVPIAKMNEMDRNPLFNHFLQLEFRFQH